MLVEMGLATFTVSLAAAGFAFSWVVFAGTFAARVESIELMLGLLFTSVFAFILAFVAFPRRQVELGLKHHRLH
jgi:hypothetical protein